MLQLFYHFQGTDNMLELFKICSEEEISKQLKKRIKKIKKKQRYSFECSVCSYFNIELSSQCVAEVSDCEGKYLALSSFTFWVDYIHCKITSC